MLQAAEGVTLSGFRKDVAPMLSYDDAIQQEMALSLSEEN